MISSGFTPIIGTLAYIWDRERDAVLMVHRIARPDDEQLGKFNGLGGKLEVDESVVEGLRREMREEAALELTSFSLRGTITWSNFGPKGQDWLGFIFLVDGWEGEPPKSNEEGPLEWVGRPRLMQSCDEKPAVRTQANLPMWPGDRFFIPLVFDRDPRAFHGTMPYDGSEPKSWQVERI